MSNFNDEELEEAANLAEQDDEQTKPAPKKMVKTFINPTAFKEDISINMADLDNAFITQASLFAHYGTQAAKASEQMDNLKLVLDVKEAQLNTLHRDLLFKAFGKVTETMIANAVMTDPRYIKARKMYNESKGVVEMLKASTEAFRQRRDMLVQVGAMTREERKGELFLKSKEVSSDDLRERTRKAVG